MARWGPNTPHMAQLELWVARVLSSERPLDGDKALEKKLLDVHHYDPELVARCCSHVEILEAAGVVVRSPVAMFWHMLKRGAADGTFHELATPNRAEHEEHLRRLRDPLPRRERAGEPALDPEDGAPEVHPDRSPPAAVAQLLAAVVPRSTAIARPVRVLSADERGVVDELAQEQLLARGLRPSSAGWSVALVEARRVVVEELWQS